MVLPVGVIKWLLFYIKWHQLLAWAGYHCFGEDGTRDVEAERFIALILRERFDYTLWWQNQPEPADSIEEMSQLAMLQRAAD